tara:strand:+ start:4678 stop:5835 length:1158 start_codon:yes stop_codon:yes gene_type:complete
MIEEFENKLFGKNNRYTLSKNEFKELYKDFNKSNILITGAAGSIGSIFTKEMNNFNFNKLYLLDKDEHLLAELARSLNLICKSKINKITFICCDLNSFNLGSFLKKNSISHYLNFAALKHVRSEETFESSIYMYNTNCIYPFKIGILQNLKKLKKIFFISTDKSVYPLSLMGLTKKIMEDKLFKLKKKFPKIFISSVRFANVSFSNGSLLKSIYEKTINNTIFGVPYNVKRYFIKQKEASNLCLKALLKDIDGQILLPSYQSVGKAYDLSEISKKIVILLGKKPLFCSKPKKIKKNVQQIIIQKKNIIGQKVIEKLYEKEESITYFSRDRSLLKTPLKQFISIKNIDNKVLNSKNINQLRSVLKKASKNKNFKTSQYGIKLNRII